MQEKYYIAAYGSLRKGCYNFAAFSTYFGDGIKWIETFDIKGFKLYSMGAYPGIKLGNEEDKLTIDILEVTPLVFQRINNMETGANYTPMTLKLGNYPEVYIYLQNGNLHENWRVKSGDWVKHLEEKEYRSKQLIDTIEG